MAITRQANLLGQQRVDVPHLRALESATAADFDVLAGSIMAGQQPVVVKGFDLITTGAIGALASNLRLQVAGGLILHPTASETGTVFAVDEDTEPETLSGTNAKVSGSFTPLQTNYIGLDLRRYVDDSTSDLVMFLDANTKLETPKTVPLARILGYRILITTLDFASTAYVLPLAKVVTDAQNKVTSLVDARPLLFRLGSGGSTPDKLSTFTWVQGRDEAVNDSAGRIFDGGDKGISSLKQFGDAIMTRLWELGGGEHWYSPTSDRDVKLCQGTPLIAANSDNFLFDGTNLQWSGLSLVFANSTAVYNDITAGTKALPDGYCLYVDVNRASNATLTVPAAVPVSSLGSPTVPGSRYVLAWRRGNNVFIRGKEYEVGRAYKYATATAGSSGLGVVRLAYNAGTLALPTVLPLTAAGQITSNGLASGNTSAFYGLGSGNRYGFEGRGGPLAGNAGVHGTGGAADGVGVIGVGGATDGVGVKGVGTGSGAGVRGSSSTGPGVYGYADTAAAAVEGDGQDIGPGVKGTSSAGIGVEGVGNSGAGVKGTSTSGPGVHGVSDSGYGVHGYSADATEASVYGYADHNNPAIHAINDDSGPGVKAEARAVGNAVEAYSDEGTGKALYTESGDNYAGHLKRTAGTGPALLVEGVAGAADAVVAQNGGVQIPVDKEFTYATARTRYLVLTAPDFSPITAVGVPNTAGLGGTGTDDCWRADPSQKLLVVANARLPAGAQIVGVKFWLNATHAIECIVQGLTKATTGAGPDPGFPTLGIMLNKTQNSAVGSSWQNFALEAGTWTVPDSGYVRLTFVASTGVGQTLELFAVRIEYTQTKLAPAV